MTHNCLGSTHQLRSGAARLVRLAAVTCLALAAGSAAVWAQPVGVVTTGHRCIHDELQQRVLRSMAQEHDNLGTLSAVGLPVVAAATDLDSVSGTVDSAFPYSTGLNVTRSTDWGELRITVSTGNFTDTERYCTSAQQEINNHETGLVECSEDDILTEEKRDILMNSILPEAVRLHTERLKVRQVQDTWKVTEGNGKICGNFTVPHAHVTDGVNNTDFLLYVASVPSKHVLSWGATCQVFPNGQPAVGVINIPAAKIVSRYDQRIIRTVAHQIAHVLGFGDRFFRRAGITRNVTTIRDMPGNFTVINGSKTMKNAREHYGCESLEHLEMEGRDTLDMEISHMKMRNAKDELMAPEVGAGYYSALTMAIFEDTGFYQANFSKAEVMPWGRNAGCDFLNRTCMKDNITQWPQMFCNGSQVRLSCPSDRLGVGICGIESAENPLPSYFQYFTNTTLGGQSLLMDYCPFVGAELSGACNQNSSTAPHHMSAFNVFSDTARCIDGAFAPKNMSKKSVLISGTCAHVRCDNTTNTYSVQVKGSSAYVNCTEGQNITLYNISDAFETGSYITCPPYVEVCQGNVKAAMDFKADLEKSRGTSSSSGRGDNHTDSMSSSGRGHTPTDSMPSSGRGHTPADSMPSSGQGHTPADSMPSSGQGHTPTDSMPNSGSGANKPDAASTNGKGDRLYPLGNSAAGLHSARTLVSAGVALLVVTLTVGLSA